jgi:hypothetical protein
MMTTVMLSLLPLSTAALVSTVAATLAAAFREAPLSRARLMDRRARSVASWLLNTSQSPSLASSKISSPAWRANTDICPCTADVGQGSRLSRLLVGTGCGAADRVLHATTLQQVPVPQVSRFSRSGERCKSLILPKHLLTQNCRSRGHSVLPVAPPQLASGTSPVHPPGLPGTFIQAHLWFRDDIRPQAVVTNCPGHGKHSHDPVAVPVQHLAASLLHTLLQGVSHMCLLSWLQVTGASGEHEAIPHSWTHAAVRNTALCAFDTSATCFTGGSTTLQLQ